MARKASNRGQAALHQPKDREARSMLVMLERLHGKTLRELQAEFHLSEDTIVRDLRRARDNNLIIAKAHEVLLRRLLPKVFAVYDAHLEDGNLEAARDILHFFERTHSQGVHSAATDGADTLEVFRERYFRRVTPATAPPPPAAGDAVIEAIATPTAAPLSGAPAGSADLSTALQAFRPVDDVPKQ